MKLHSEKNCEVFFGSFPENLKKKPLHSLVKCRDVKEDRLLASHLIEQYISAE